MPDTPAGDTTRLLNRFAMFALLIGLFALSYQVLRFFVVPFAWAAIVGYMTWPIYIKLLKHFKSRTSSAASLMTFGLVTCIGIPLFFGLFKFQQEAMLLYNHIQGQIQTGQVVLPSGFENIPILGDRLKQIVAQLNTNPDPLFLQGREWLKNHMAYGQQIFSGVTRGAAQFSMALLTLFFIYRDGKNLLRHIRNALRQILGMQADGYLLAIGQTTRAVVYGIGLTALAQSFLAGLGYFVAGLPSPLVLSLITFLFALIPFGTPLAWGSVVMWLFLQNQTMAAIGLGLWCLVVVGSIDNIIRPMVISGSTQIPFLLIMFGVLGGVAAFGMLGLFLGPIILAVLLAVWRQWLYIHPNEELDFFKEHETPPPV